MTLADLEPDTSAPAGAAPRTSPGLAGPEGVGSGPSGRPAASGVAGFAQNKLLAIADNGKQQALSSFDGVLDLVHELADRFEGEATAPIAGFLRNAAGSIEDLRHDIESKSVEELIDDGRRLVQRQPGLAVGLAAVIGFVAARLIRVGAESSQHQV